MGNASELELMISSAIAKDDAREKLKKNDNKLRITRGAYEKIKLYAELTSRITHTAMECYGYLIRPKWSTDDLITNVYFADDQINSPAHTLVPVEGIKKAMEKVDSMDYEIVGWWHSHGSFNTFHSGTDITNFKRVHNGISPHTLFRYEEAPYIVDEEHSRVVFEDYALTDLKPEELQIFKDRFIRSLKRVKQDPFAFSFVVNNAGERYIERASKKKDPVTGDFKVSPPTYPLLEIVDAKNDLEFLVADVEWEVREKIALHGSNYTNLDDAQPDSPWESSGSASAFTSNRSTEGYAVTEESTLYGESIGYQEPTAYLKPSSEQNPEPTVESIVDRFIISLVGYIRQKGVYQKHAYNMLFSESSDIFSEIASKPDTAENQKEGSAVKLKSSREDVKKRLVGYLEELPEPSYSAWSQKIHLFDRQHIVVWKFIEEFCGCGNGATNTHTLDAQNSVFEKYNSIASKLSSSFEIADKAMKSMTKYAMETITDYNGKKNHKYRNFIGAVITKLAGKEAVSFEEACQSVISSPWHCSRNKVFIWEDRFDICDQMVMDTYNVNGSVTGSSAKGSSSTGIAPKGSGNYLPQPKENRKHMVKFFKNFAQYFQESPDKLDGLIESEILSRSGVSSHKYHKFNDSEYKPLAQSTITPDFSIYRPKKAVRVKEASPSYKRPQYTQSTASSGSKKKPNRFYKIVRGFFD